MDRPRSYGSHQSSKRKLSFFFLNFSNLPAKSPQGCEPFLEGISCRQERLQVGEGERSCDFAKCGLCNPSGAHPGQPSPPPLPPPPPPPSLTPSLMTSRARMGEEKAPQEEVRLWGVIRAPAGQVSTQLDLEQRRKKSSLEQPMAQMDASRSYFLCRQRPREEGLAKVTSKHIYQPC